MPQQHSSPQDPRRNRGINGLQCRVVSLTGRVCGRGGTPQAGPPSLAKSTKLQREGDVQSEHCEAEQNLPTGRGEDECAPGKGSSYRQRHGGACDGTTCRGNMSEEGSIHGKSSVLLKSLYLVLK